MNLRPYQVKLVHDIYDSWRAGHRNVLAVSATGSGKTVTFAEVMLRENGYSVAIAHRHELVTQISVALARNGVRHRIVGSQSVIRHCINLHISELGNSFYDPNSKSVVASVNTLVKLDKNEPWINRVTLWVLDEFHHCVRDNVWGNAVSMFPNARGLGVTATPIRGDGKGLGRHADGVIDHMVLAPSMRDLINMGFLTDYRIFAKSSDLDLSNVPTSASGDYSPVPLRAAVHKSHITGDVVEHYLRLANGKLGVTFCVDVQAATETAEAFRKAGVNAEVITGETPPELRASILRRFAKKEVIQLCSVDIFSEGFDLPAIEVVSLARPTMSFGLYCQQLGRALRLMINPELTKIWSDLTDEQRLWHIANSTKPYAIILDHSGNVHKHGLPDAHREWSLDRREKRSRKTPDDVIPTTSCQKCASVYERTFSECPYCDYKAEPASRSGPEFVDGVLSELDQEALAKLRGEVDKPLAIPHGASPEIVGSLRKHYHAKKQAQGALCNMIALYGGYQTHMGRSIEEAQKRFFWHFGIDVLSAQALGRQDAEELKERIINLLTRKSIQVNVA